jgi:predicted unusual protein kinase regulating ubiquinone biosynthesis (AarF/ABC1/UbiB family)
MMGDLKQIRRFGGFIQKTEIKFDMLSAVDELAGQVELEFDFLREAKVMDQVADNLQASFGGFSGRGGGGGGDINI